MDKIELKKCPFCGGPAEIVDNSRYDPGTYFVACASCGARGDASLMDAIEARDRWNRGPIQIRAEVA